MSKFARPAAWLRQLFTSSRTEFRNPSTLSNDVSLIQPFDGSGWFLSDSSMWYMTADSAVGATVSTPIGAALGENVYARLLAASIVVIASTSPNDATIELIMPNGTDVVGIASLGRAVTGSVLQDAFNNSCPIIGPGMRLQGTYWGGGASTQCRWKALWVEVPAGTVFYV